MLEYYRFKKIADFFSEGKNEEAMLQLAELQRRYIGLCDENLTFKTQIQEYEDILYLARNLFFDGEVYWLVTGSIKQGPFCSECYNKEGLLMRLAGDSEDRHCPTCHMTYRSSLQQIHEVAVGGTDRAIQRDESIPQPAKRGKILPFQRS